MNMIARILSIAFGLVLSVMLIASIVYMLHAVYESGVEDGYWEHEAEENIYKCEVI